MLQCKRGVRALAAAFLLAAAPVGAAEEGRAVAAVQGSGEVFPTSPNRLTIHASYIGILYQESGRGALDGAVMHCPVVQTLDLEKRRGEGEGHCILTAGEGNVAYAEWRCSGEAGGCEGELRFVAGTGTLAGITGGGKFTARVALTETASGLQSGGTIRNAIGVMIWPALRYEVPAR